MNTVDILFYLFSTLALGGGLLMVCSKHPVSAAMFMIISLVGVAALFVLLEAFFLAVLQILVYAGAVITFPFHYHAVGCWSGWWKSFSNELFRFCRRVCSSPACCFSYNDSRFWVAQN